MKLNKNGWGLVVEILILLAVVVMLIYAIYGLNRLGLIRNVNQALGTDVLPDLVISGKTLTYSIVEQDLIDASEEYVTDNYSNNIETETVVRLSRLVSEGYISTIRDADNNKCSGYILVNKPEQELVYTPYLKCSEYETEGYSEEFDW